MNYLAKINEAFIEHMAQHARNLDLELQNLERKDAYEVRPATIGEVATLVQHLESNDAAKHCVVYIFNLKRTGESRVIVASPDVNPMALNADDLDMLWSRFEKKQ